MTVKAIITIIKTVVEILMEAMMVGLSNKEVMIEEITISLIRTC